MVTIDALESKQLYHFCKVLTNIPSAHISGLSTKIRNIMTRVNL